MGTKNNPGEWNCYANAEPDEPMFNLLARDLTAEHFVAAWVDLRAGDVEKAKEKMDLAAEALKAVGKVAKPRTDPKLAEAAWCATMMKSWRHEKEMKAEDDTGELSQRGSPNQTSRVQKMTSIRIVDQEGREYQKGTVYRCPVHLIREADGEYSVIAATLPGVASQGTSEQDALDNIKEALAAAISVYVETNTLIPWLERPQESSGGVLKYVIVVF